MDRLYLTQQVPTLIVWGEHDSIIPVSHAHDAHAAMPNSRLEIVAGAGHFPHVEAPRDFLRVLRDFMETTVPATLAVHQFQRILRERAHAMN